MAFMLSAITPTRISEDAGTEIIITGTFEVGHRYFAYIGESGDDTDYPCHSGVPSQGNYLYLQNDGSLKCYSPLLPPDKTLTLTVKNVDTVETHNLVDSVTTAYRSFHTTVFKLRKVMPPFYKAGIRDIELID